MKLYAPSTINEIKGKYGFRLSKSLGQNFLTDNNIIEKIIEGSHIGEGDLVIEIGPGIGVITAEAAGAAGKVIAIEIDSGLIPILKDTLSQYDNVEVINQDILKTDLNRIIATQNMANVKIIGNLPYYITTPIIMKILEDGVKADSITAMMQKEVADRIKAGPGTKAYGALSIAVQYYCDVKVITSVPRQAFIPQPSVDSVVLRMDVRKEKPIKVDNEELFFACVKAGFGQRRKTLLNSLMGVRGASKEIIGEALKDAGIDSVRRAETLDLKEFAALANELEKRL